ncbi:MAG: ROK family protein [Chloroflexi bacterium]|nr:ROK family protein [Chloroflexota bacterium]
MPAEQPHANPSGQEAGASRRWTLALDIGGTKLAAGLVDRDGRVAVQASVPTNAHGTPEALFADLAALADSILARGGVRASEIVGVGVGCGGPMLYPEGRVSPLNIPAWRDFPLRAALQERYGRPAIVDNDAKALALGEYRIGAGQNARCLLGMVVSTGVGGGIVEAGRLIHGARGNAGHLGHVIAFRDGPACECGARGCVEAVASGTALAKRATLAKKQGLLPDLPPRPTGADVVAAARAGEPTAARFVEEAGMAVGRGIAATAVLLDLDRVVIGGSVALGAGDLLLGPLLRELAGDAQLDYCRGFGGAVSLSDLGVQAALAGAAALLQALPGGDLS